MIRYNGSDAESREAPEPAQQASLGEEGGEGHRERQGHDLRPRPEVLGDCQNLHEGLPQFEEAQFDHGT